MESTFPHHSFAESLNSYTFASTKRANMKRKTIGIIGGVLVLGLVGAMGWNLRYLPQQHLLHEAEDIVFTDADSAKRILERVDTTRLTESSQMLYDLLRAMVHEEQWYAQHCDTASCLSSDAGIWNFKREAGRQEASHQAFPDDSTLSRVYRYYEEESLGGASDDQDALRHFGRICFVLSGHQGEKALPSQVSKFFHLAIHCAETAEDHSLAYRAYDKFASHKLLPSSIQQEQAQRRALEHYRLSADHPRWLLTILNDYGYHVLHSAPFDLHHFSSLERIVNMAALHCKEPASPQVTDSIYQTLDSLWALPHPNFSPTLAFSIRRGVSITGDITVPIGMYEEAYADTANHWPEKYETIIKWSEQEFATSQGAYLASGYVKKSALTQRYLMLAIIVILLLSLLFLAFLFRNWHLKTRQQHEAEQNAHQREAHELAERLRQKDTVIAMLRGHIMDKSEILDMLETKANKRTIINARNWREIEMTLDTADGNFVSRLRAEHPQFSEDDIRLCMLTRLKLSNTALSAIYAISVSAVQHRKQKLKKEGFGVTDPTITFDQIIANY